MTEGRARGAYDQWLERNATVTVWIYAAFIAVLMPGFHFVLNAVPGHPPDPLWPRIIAATISIFAALSLLIFRPLRKHAEIVQLISMIPTMLIVVVLVVNSGNHWAYVSAGLLMIVGAQQAFYREDYLAIAMGLALIFQAQYSALSGHFFDAANIAALAIYASAYVLTYIPASLRMGIQRREIMTRLAAQRLADTLAARDRALTASQERLAEVHAITHLGSWTKDLQTGEVTCSEELLRILDLPVDTPARAMQGLYDRFIHPADQRAVVRAIADAKGEGLPFNIDHRIVISDQSVRWVNLRGKYDYDEHGKARKLVSAVFDITRRKENEEALRKLAALDALTGLANRGSLQRRLEAEIARAASRKTKGAILFFDLDRFKEINDTLGHSVGDLLLRAFAKRLQSSVPEDALVSRYSGDEFVVLLGEMVSDGAVKRLVDELSRVLAAPFPIDGYELVVTPSIGIAVFPDHGSEAGVLLRNAERAMYYSKKQYARGHAMFENTMHDDAKLRHRVQNALRKALGSGDFVLHYQPIVEAATGQIVAAEALIRWNEAGVLQHPTRFIAVAEETGLIVPIGTWVLQEACAQLAQWNARGMQTRLCVNISARHLMHPDFLVTLNSTLQASRIDATQLEIEITETAFLRDIDRALTILAEINATGATVAIDDFGSGQSALMHLRHFPLDRLKLDRGLVAGIADSQQRVIARSIVKIAHVLGLSVTAEGVETREQYELLGEMRCDAVQGYYVAEPMPPNEFEKMLRGERPLVEPPHIADAGNVRSLETRRRPS